MSDPGFVHVINWLLALVSMLFIEQVLSEILFPPPPATCPSCGLDELPSSLLRCPDCNHRLEHTSAEVPRSSRALAYFFPLITFFACVIAFMQLSGSWMGTHLAVLGFIIANAAFVLFKLKNEERRVRALYFIPLTPLLLLGLIGCLWEPVFDLAGLGDDAPPPVLQIGEDSTEEPVYFLDGRGLFRGLGATATSLSRFPLMRDLLPGARGTLLPYFTSGNLESPDGLIAGRSLDLDPEKGRVRRALHPYLERVGASPDMLAYIRSIPSRPQASLTLVGDTLWMTDGQSLYRYNEEIGLQDYEPSRLLQGAIVGLASHGTRLLVGTTHGVLAVQTGQYFVNEFYPLLDLMPESPRLGRRFTAIGASGVGAVLGTSMGEIFRFDLKRQRLSYLGQGRGYRYMDFYNLYTLPFVGLGLLFLIHHGLSRRTAA